MKIITFSRPCLFWIILLISLLPAQVAHSRSDGPLLFVGDHDYPPLEYLHKGVPRGINVEIAQELSHILHRKIEIKLMPWHKAQQMVIDGKADALIGLSVSDERKMLYDFCDVTQVVEFSLFHREHAVGIRGQNDLAGKVVGVTRGGYPSQMLKDNPDITLMPVDSYMEGFRLLQEGMIHVFAADKWVGAYTIQNNQIKGITVDHEPFAVRENTFAVKKGNTPLHNEINLALHQLQNTGELKRIHDKWQSQKIVITTHEKIRNWTIKASLTIAAISLCILTGWFLILKRQIQRRKKSEERYSSMINSITEGFVLHEIIYDKDHQPHDYKYLEINPAFERMTGLKRDRILGKTILQTVPDEGPFWVEIYGTLAQSGQPVHLEHYSARLRKHFEAVAYRTGPDQFAVLFIDITERKNSEEALRVSEEKFRNIFDNAIEGIYQTTPEGVFINVNKAHARMYGYDSPAEVVASVTDVALQHYADPRKRDEFKQIIETQGKVRNYEFEARRKNGETFWVSNNARAVRDKEGKILYYEGTNIDITKRIAAEEALASAYKLNKEIISSVDEGIILYDRNMCYQLWNPFMERQTGIMESELLGKRIAEYYPSIKEYGIDQILQSILAGQTYHSPPFAYDISHTGKKGWALATGTPQRNEKNEVVGVIVSIRDITSQRKMEERLGRAEKMEALGLLAGGVAHDLNNVIGISMGYSEMLLEEMEADSPLRSHVVSIMMATEKAAAIVEDMLTMARRGVAVNKVINLNQIVAEYLESPELLRLLALHPGAEIHSPMDPGLLNISGSPVHLNKVINNLVMNAAEALRDHGVISIKTQNVHLDRPVKGYDSFAGGDYAVLTVSDTGEGIAAKDLEHIFEPFYTRKIMGRSGTGLGLAVVWGTIKDHNGYIDVESEPGKGTTFTLYFPVIREELTKQADGIERTTYTGQGETILVVDDIQQQRELATVLLSKLNYLVTSVSSGEEAVEFLKKTKVDLLLLDMIMDPGIDGLETYRRILEINPHQRAIIVSGFAETQRVVEAQKLGAGAYVKKPYIVENLGTAVRQELDRKEEKG